MRMVLSRGEDGGSRGADQVVEKVGHVVLAPSELGSWVRWYYIKRYISINLCLGVGNASLGSMHARMISVYTRYGYSVLVLVQVC